MSEHDAQARPLVDFWTRAMEQAARDAKSMLQSPEGEFDPRGWRRQWLDALSHTTEACLRSPPLLKMLGSYIDALVDAKRRQQPPPLPTGSLAGDIKAMGQRIKQLQRQLEWLKESSDQAIAGDLDSPWAQPAGDADRAAPPVGSSTAPKQSARPMHGVTACDIVYQEGIVKLLRYRNESIRLAEPILICFALVNRPYILDLKEDRSVVRRLLDRGFDVYLIDWGVPDETDRHLALEDYIGRFLSNVVEFVCDSSGTRQLNLLGYCMGGTMSTIFTALKQDRVRNLILMATPIDFGGDKGLLNLWARREYFDVDRLVDALGNCPGELLQLVFQLLKPVQNFAEKQLMLSENLHDAGFVENFVALERWSNDTVPVAGETFRQYVKSLYQQNQLIRDQMSLGGVRVRPQSITCPLLLLVAEKDHLVPPESTLALQRYVASSDIRLMSIDAGHVGLAVSSRAHRQLWPEAANWIANHSTER